MTFAGADRTISRASFFMSKDSAKSLDPSSILGRMCVCVSMKSPHKNFIFISLVIIKVGRLKSVNSV